ncbi:hypothetical protein Ahia01_001136100 [Argonauta hians]
MDDLESLSYQDLRNLAKDLGIKAKGKAKKLILEIRRIRSGGSSPQNERQSSIDTSLVRTDEISSDEEITFVLNPMRRISTDVVEMEEVPLNITGELADTQAEIDKLNEDHNQTVDFEDLEKKREAESNILNTTYELLPVSDDADNDAGVVDTESAVDKNDSVSKLLDVMKPEMTDEQMKSELISAIEKRVKEKSTTAMTPGMAKKFEEEVNMVSSLKKKSTSALSAEGAKWRKIHEKMFNKYDSLDVYLDKKNKRAKKLITPAKLTNKVLNQPDSLQTKKSKIPKPSVCFVPQVTDVKDICLQFTNSSSSSKLPKSVNKECKIASRQLCAATEQVYSSPKKTHRTSFMSPKSTEKRPFSPLNFSVNKTSSATKKKFDLQASLSKPISWKKHTGKLRPVAIGDTEPQYFKKGLTKTVEDNRKSCRQAIKTGRTSRRENLLNSRRNIH